MDQAPLSIVETALVIAVFFAPPVLISLGVLALIWRRSSRQLPFARFAVSAIACVALGAGISLAILLFAPPLLLPLLGPRDVSIVPVWAPIFPGAFVGFGLALAVSQRWLRATV